MSESVSDLDLARETANAPSAGARPVVDRAALVHDWFQGFHGSERVVEAILSGVFARDRRPDVYTYHAVRELLPPLLGEAIVKESRLARLPGIRQRGHDPGRWRYLLPLMPSYFRSLDLDAYDVVVSSSHACAVNARARADALHVCYCYTPIRYAWLGDVDRRHGGVAKGFALRCMSGWLRRVDREASRHPDSYVAISTAVRDRIRAFYGRDAVVIHPPVDVHEFVPRKPSDPTTFLWVHRLVGYKHPELVMEAFRGSPYRLVMVGVGPLDERLRANLPPNVELHGWLSREDLARLYSEAAGFIHIAEEDFGITMVEALAAGTPVIGLNRGGARDIVRDGVDGVLIGQPDVNLVRDAVERVAGAEWSPESLAARARKFSRDRFVKRFTSHLVELGAKAA